MRPAQHPRSRSASTPMLAGRSAAYNRAVMAKRSYGSGRLFVYKDKTGKESWYGSWRAGTRRVQRKIGPERAQGGKSGLTRVQAERELRKRIDHNLVLATAERKTLADAGALYIDHLENALGAIQEWMGHTDAKTTEIYRHHAPDPTNGAQLVERAFSATQPSAPNENPTREQAR